MGKSSLDNFREFFLQRMNSPSDNHFGCLRLQCRFIEAGRAGMDLPYNAQLIGNPASGVMAGGPMTALMDTCCAVAAATATDVIGFCPTLDLRMDHMGLAEAGKMLRAEAEAYRVTRSIIFTRGIIYHDDPERPIARGLVNFTPITHTIIDTQSRVRNEAPPEGSAT
ncbi:MAG: PaaI family thioesterase [Cellvibrionaceae bacterium]